MVEPYMVVSSPYLVLLSLALLCNRKANWRVHGAVLLAMLLLSGIAALLWKLIGSRTAYLGGLASVSIVVVLGVLYNNAEIARFWSENTRSPHPWRNGVIVASVAAVGVLIGLLWRCSG